MIKALDSFENIALELAARAAPWLAPILPAYVVGRSLYEHLDVWPAIAITGAIGFEIVGIASAKNALRCWTWNGGKRKSDPAAPLGLAVALALVYFVVGISLSVALEVWPDLAAYAPASFFVLAGASYLVLAISHNLTKWEAAIRGEREDRDHAAEVRKLTQERDSLANEVSVLKQRLKAASKPKPERQKAAPPPSDKQERLDQALQLFKDGETLEGSTLR